MTKQGKPLIIGCAAVLVFGLMITGIVVHLAIRTFRSGDTVTGLRDIPIERAPEDTGKRMDYGWRVRSLDGEPYPLERAKGKPVFLNFWATWCPPCRAEMPALEGLHEKVGNEGVVFLIISQEPASAVQDFAGKRNLALPLYTMEGGLPSALRYRAIPTTFIVAPDGRIVFEHRGAGAWDAEPVADYLRSLAEAEPAEGL